MTNTPQKIPGNVEHETSSGLQIIDVRNGDAISKVLVDRRTRQAFPMDETQWRELEMYVFSVVVHAPTI